MVNIVQQVCWRTKYLILELSSVSSELGHAESRDWVSGFWVLVTRLSQGKQCFFAAMLLPAGNTDSTPSSSKTPLWSLLTRPCLAFSNLSIRVSFAGNYILTPVLPVAVETGRLSTSLPKCVGRDENNLDLA